MPAMPSPRDDDEDLPPGALPRPGALGEDEELVGAPEDDADLGLSLEGGEDVGLDDDVAEEAALDMQAVVGLLDGLADEGEPWTRGTEAVDDLLGGDEIDGASEGEYGWTDDTEAPGLDEWEDDIAGLGESLGPSMLDDGAEGTDESFDIDGDDDAAPLPALDAGVGASAEEAAEDLDLSGWMDLAEDLSFEEEARMSGRGLPPAMPADRLEVALRGAPEPIYAIAPREAGVLAAGTSIRSLAEGGGARPSPVAGLPDDSIVSIAVDPTDGASVAVGTRTSGAYVEVDGRFERLRLGDDDDAAITPCEVVTERAPGGARLYVRTARGDLFVSRDFGGSFERVRAAALAIVAPPDGGIVVATPRGEGVALARSSDGGRRFESAGGLGDRPAGGLHVARLGDVLALSGDEDAGGVRVSRDGGETFEALDDLPRCGPMLIVHEAGAPVLYAALYFAGSDRGVVVRRPLDGASHLLVDVSAERERARIEAAGEVDGDNRVFALSARRHGERTLLDVATAFGLLRVVVHGVGSR